MFDITVTSFIRNLTNMRAVLDKAYAWQTSMNITDEAIMNARLALDQFPLAKQVQLMSDFSKKAGALLCNVETPSFEDNEKSIAELQARLDKTIAFLSTLSAETMATDLDTKMVPFKWVSGKGFIARYYIESYSIPQFYFHYTTAYSILRHHGLPIGKQEFMGALDLRDMA